MAEDGEVIAGLTAEQAAVVDRRMRWAAEQAGWRGAALALEAFANRLEGATLDASSAEQAAGAAEAFRMAAQLARDQAKAILSEKLG